MYDGIVEVLESTGGDGCLTGSSDFEVGGDFASRLLFSSIGSVVDSSLSGENTSSGSAFETSSKGSVATVNSDSSLP